MSTEKKPKPEEKEQDLPMDAPAPVADSYPDGINRKRVNVDAFIPLVTEQELTDKKLKERKEKEKKK